ncbi:MAG TPA: YqgE/AlgH family protein [Xanthobacteraceae bacterium]
MRCLWIGRFGLLLAAVLAAPTLLRAALPGPAEPSPRASLAGQLLVASPSITDPRFYRAVILMVRHDPRGALGIAINRPIEERPLAALLEATGEKNASVTGSALVFAGGPVQPELGFVLHSAEYRRPETMEIDGRVAMTNSREILRDIANHQGPAKVLIAFGYAGWGAGQLEHELEQGFWIAVPEDPALVFDHDRGKLWDDAMKRRTQDL